MSTLSTLIMVALLALAIGAVIGALGQQFFGSPPSKQREMAKKLAEAEQRLATYQEEVTETFAETARRVNKLTASYKDVHDHLANSAMKLTSANISQQFLTTETVKQAATEDIAEEIDMEKEEEAFETEIEEELKQPASIQAKAQID